MVSRAAQRSFVLTAGFASLALADAAIAGNVYVVSPSGPYTQIQPAIDAASDYDTILVKPHPSPSSSYNGFIVNGKSLVIVGDPIVGQPVRVRGEMRFDATPASGLLVLSSIDGAGLMTFPGTRTLRSVSNLGSVRVQNCQLTGARYPCAQLIADADTQFVASDILGRDLVYSEPVNGDGTGVHSIDTTLRLFGCNVSGGNGVDAAPNPDPEVGILWGGSAGDALAVDGGWAFAAATTFHGGDGGVGSLYWCPEGGGADGGHGGDGIQVGYDYQGGGITSQMFTLSCTMQGGLGADGGAGACPGADGQSGLPVRLISSGAVWQPFNNGSARYLSGAPLARENASVALTARGVAGDRVYVRIELVDPSQTFPFSGIHSPIGPAQKPRFVFLGTIPASGTLSTTIPTGPLGAGVQSRLWRLRSTFVVSSGAVAEGNDFVVAIVDSAL
jgi:hypothetical protein